ncbi:unnamed protein product [Cyprideis torosa]|uniref:Uncharacterized protein n=1 Tax=Cyprideis torosa TaxID=163714 RepID=A0A7R8W900_9CRUS|nr:unnamed protein product [Cyprideis torosa]CAG0889179.1 unnamed protein product [Cyprideis torosa]
MSEVREIVKILILIVLWYVVSASNNVIGKSVLMQFPYPMTLTMVQLLSIALYSGPLFRVFGVRSNKQKLSSDEDNQRGYTEEPSWRYWWTYVIPLAFGKFFSSVSGHVSLWKVSVSYAHTVKASMPFFTVLLVRILFGEKQTRPVYISLIPIVCGVMIATATEMSFDMIGLISAVIATIGFSLQNIFSKKVLIDTGMHHLRLLQVLGQIALFMFLPCWLFFDFRSILLTKNEFQTHPVNILLLLFTDGLFSFLQNIFAFSVLSMVTPLTYAVANASKRVAIISVSLLFFRNPVTALNILGMLLAIVGVLGYNKVRKFYIQCLRGGGVTFYRCVLVVGGMGINNSGKIRCKSSGEEAVAVADD